MHARVEPDLLFPPDPARAARGAPGAGARSRRRTRTRRSSREEIALEPGLASEALRARLRALGALRIKGFVETREGMRVVQGVGPRIELVRRRRAAAARAREPGAW